jgi:hypothetical protein
MTLVVFSVRRANGVYILLNSVSTDSEEATVDVWPEWRDRLQRPTRLKNIKRRWRLAALKCAVC